MSQFFTLLEELRNQSNWKKKGEGLTILQRDFSNIYSTAKHSLPVGSWDTVSYRHFTTEVPGVKVPDRNNLETTQGQAVFFHAIVHIEYTAIDLALDHAYRFRNFPEEYYRNWVQVAYEETLHFELLLKILHSLGYEYGDFPVHSGLYQAAKRSSEDLCMRMAALPGYMEANGLDAHASLASKSARFPKQLQNDFLAAMEIIARDEIQHVAHGLTWFRYACRLFGRSELEYKQLVETAVPGAKFHRKNVNWEARLKAGFSKSELALFA